MGRRHIPAAVHVQRSRAGLGLFAEETIEKGQFVIEYTGELISNDEADRRGNKYLFELNSKWTIDGSARSNTARYINHSCRPNCETDVIRRRVKIFAKRRIKPGEELTYDYGKAYVDEYIKPNGCKCEKCKAKKDATQPS
ncbi:MAG: SET domain-containing protein-lysine N-methyltransferase [Candidatus Paceibacterota bacterium]